MNDNEVSSVIANEPADNRPLRFKCDVCGEMFRDLRELGYHSDVPYLLKRIEALEAQVRVLLEAKANGSE